MDSPLALAAESRIQEALDAGAERELAGRGQPLDLEAYFAAPASLRAGFGLLKSAQVAPPEVEAFKEVARLRELLATTTDAQRAALLREELQIREVELAMGLERMKRTLKADATA